MAPSPELALKPDTVIDGRYRIVRPLGNGGMGWVFLAQDVQHPDTSVAIKFLYPHLVAQDIAFARFRNEVLVARKLLHPNIVRTYNIGINGLHSYIAMEYVEGPTLRTLIESERQTGLPLDRILAVAGGVGAALAHAHALGIVHRDIKPDNIFCHQENTAKVGDFGLAATLRRQTQLTGAGQAIGTPLYMPPEQFLGHPTDIRSDIYSFGVLLYELVSGTVPFQHPSLYGLGQKHLHEPLPFHQRFHDSEFANLWAVIERSTAKSAGDRHPSMRELLSELDSAFPGRMPQLATLPLETHPAEPPAPQFDELFLARRRRWIALIASVVGTIIIIWCRWNLAAQSVLAVPITMAERRFDTRFRTIRWFLNTEIPEEHTPLATEMGYAVQRMRSRLFAGDDPDDPTNIERVVSSGKPSFEYPIHVAARTLPPKRVTNLLAFFPNPNVRNSGGQTALHIAVERGERDLVKLFLEVGNAIPNIVDRKGETPLVIAARKAAGSGNIEIVETLLQFGANPAIEDTQHLTAVDHAVILGGSPELLRLLLNHLAHRGAPYYSRLRTELPPEAGSSLAAVLDEYEHQEKAP